MSFNYSPKVVTSGLILCLDAANQRSYPGSGTTWYDLTGNFYNGTLTNGPTYSTSGSGCIVFDGVDDYVTGSISSLSDFTVSYMINSSNTSSAFIFYPLGLQFSGSATGGGVWFGGNLAPYANKTGIYDGNTQVTSSINIQGNTWTSVSVTRSSTTATVYINGSSSGTGTISSNQILNYTLGKRTDNTWPYNGKIALTQVYNRALSATEILQNYNATKTRFGL